MAQPGIAAEGPTIAKRRRRQRRAVALMAAMRADSLLPEHRDGWTPMRALSTLLFRNRARSVSFKLAPWGAARNFTIVPLLLSFPTGAFDHIWPESGHFVPTLVNPAFGQNRSKLARFGWRLNNNGLVLTEIGQISAKGGQGSDRCLAKLVEGSPKMTEVGQCWSSFVDVGRI